MEILKKMLSKVYWKTVNKSFIRVPHPKLGHVIFTGLTNRQLDIVLAYRTIVNNQSDYPNDQEFGKNTRDIIVSGKIKNK
tara:strand:+ start:31 stop:270 length:240 start_codon:yes stop_codon:yes gene_type:complete